MLLSEYIAILQRLQDQLGPTVEVEKWMPAKGRHSAPPPTVAYTRRYPTRGVPNFYHPETDTPAQKGDECVRI